MIGNLNSKVSFDEKMHKSENKKNLFSIITVCLNAEDIIESTIRSVLEQDFDNFEYLIKDGMSNDDTVKIAESFAAAFAEKGISFKIISRRDKGIYDAMNQAVQEACGDWVLFMNAGDCFANGTVLSQVSREKTLETADVVYGDVILRDDNKYKYRKALKLEEITFCLPFCHQSSFTKKILLEEMPFSLEYRLCSDYLFYLQLYYEGKRFEYVPMAMAIYSVGGVSSDYRVNYEERLRIHEEMPVRDEKAIQRIKDRIKENTKARFMHEHFWKYIPVKIRQKRRENMRKKAGWKDKKDFFAEINKK